MEASAPTVYSLRIELLDIEPLIWRRVWVPSDVVLQRLHKVFQAVMGWQESHLHEFQFGEVRLAVPDPEGEDDKEVVDERGQRLDRLLKGGLREFQYRYDFGDGWEHRVVIEQVSAPKRLVAYPACVAGERACPPEDVGGPHGYAELLRALRGDQGGPDEDSEAEDEQRVLWIGGFYDPEGFDVNTTNIRMAKLRRLLVT
jgi:hypothetical protein